MSCRMVSDSRSSTDIISRRAGAFSRRSSRPFDFTSQTPSTMRSLRPFAVAIGMLLLASCRDPRAEANIAEAMLQVGTELSAVRQDLAVMQEQVDSLRGVV